MKKIRLSKGKQTIVDDKLFEFLNEWKWSVDRRGYACRSQKANEITDGVRHQIFLHRVVTECPKGLEVDHINHDTLDNRLVNLRVCTRGQNARNRVLQKNNSSGFTGVSWSSSRQTWIASIRDGVKQRYLGSSRDPLKAAKLYEKAAKKTYGLFINKNRFPGENSNKLG